MSEIEKLKEMLPLWEAEINISFEFPLYDCQIRAFNIIMQDKGFLAVLPTGMGKTILAIMASKYSKEIKNSKTLVLAPLRALTTEHVETFAEYGLRAMIDSGEHSKEVKEYTSKDYDSVISTFEKMDSIIRNFNPMSQHQKRDLIFGKFDTIIIDEVHSVEDESRGVNLESFIMSAKYLYPHIKIIGLSATIGNYEEFANWLGIDPIYEPPEKRPIPLDVEIIPIYSYLTRDQFEEKMDILIDDIEKNPKAKRMIAVTSVGRTRKIVYRLSEVRGDYKVQYFMKMHGMAWHHSGSRGMSEDDRMAVEWAFQYEDLPSNDQYYYERADQIINRKLWLREKYGITKGINIVVCTPTLIVGRNLPVTYINVFDHIQFTYRNGPMIIGANRLQQTTGRAGRLKFAKGKPNYKGIAKIYVQEQDVGEIEERLKPFKIVSHLGKHLGEKILAWINSRIVMNEEDIYKFLGNALDPTIKNNEKLITKEIKYLKDHKFINGETELSVTPKGMKTIRGYIQPKTVVRWGAIIAKYINDPKSLKLNSFITEAMDVDEYTEGIVTLRQDRPILTRMLQELGYPDVCEGAVKSFVFCFPNYTRRLLKINEKDYIIPNEESKAMRSQFERMITAFSEIYSHTTLRKALITSKHMVASGVFNPKLANLMALNGIGATYAMRLLKNDIDSKKKLFEMYQSDRRKLLSIMNITSKKLKTVMEKN